MTRCDCCDLPVESCGRAVEAAQRAEAGAERRRAFARPGVKAAAFPGRCAGCGESFPVGVPIRLRQREGSDDGALWQNVLCCG